MASNKTRRALFSSVLSLILCCSMLIGTTFAWFTDSVTSTGNIIKSGTLDVAMSWSNTKDGEYTDASEGAIFSYQYWEPGYTEVKFIKIENKGDLAFKYQLNILPTILPAAGEANLADVIEAYLLPAASAPADRAAADAYMQVNTGTTLSALIAEADGAAHGIMLPAEGVGSQDFKLPEDTYDVGAATYCVILHMKEEAGNEYQNLSVGEGFKVQLVATQMTYEKDSFDNLYDDDSQFDVLPNATVSLLNAEGVSTLLFNDIVNNRGDYDQVELTLDTAYAFKGEPVEYAEQSPYADWFVDFFVKLDKVPEEGLILSGQYEQFLSDWVAFRVPSDGTIEADTFYPLLGAVTGGGVSNWTYTDICSGVGTFNCGAVDELGLNAGATLTVDLRLINPENTEETVTAKTVEYTFGVNSAEKLVNAVTAGMTNIKLTADLPLSDTPITVPAGAEVTIDLNGKTLSGVSTSSAASTLIKVEKGAELTLTNGTVSFAATTPDTNWGGEGQPAYPGYANNTINNAGKLIINGATVENRTAAGGASYAIDCYPGSDLVINSGTIKGYDKVAIRMFANSNTVDTKVTVNGGEISGRRAVWVHIPGSDPNKAMMATLEINGGTLTCLDDEDCAVYSYSYGNSFANTNITITGGTFNGDVCFGGGYKGDTENVTITGGTFNGALGRHLANDGWEDITI